VLSVYLSRFIHMLANLLVSLLVAIVGITVLETDLVRLAEPGWMLLFGVALLFLARAARKHLPRRGGQPS